MIQNPILPGFHPDPCICRKEDDYYIAVSTFEWLPGIPVYHSRDLKHWELLTHILSGTHAPDLKRLPSAKGIWAPCLTYCEAEGLFYAVYGVMNSMHARYFDVDNYLITAADIMGPWSEPVYLHSAGFDASIFHDKCGKKYIVSLEWETRLGYEPPGAICCVEYDAQRQEIVSYPKRIWSGCTDRGCIEAPHLYQHSGKYYLMCAEGGTGYDHCVTLARADSPFGPYEADPEGIVLTSQLEDFNERYNTDHLKPQYYNPNTQLQKAGHGSLVELANGESYLAHLCGRPSLPEKRCVLGRETAIQKVVWTEDGWLRLASGGKLAPSETEEAQLKEHILPKQPAFDDFNDGSLRNVYYSPRLLPESFTDLTARPGWLRIRGQENLCSLNQVSLICRKLSGVYGEVLTCMAFEPELYQHSAGLVIYYDNMNYTAIEETWGSEDRPIVRIRRLENGVRTETQGVLAPAGPIWLKLMLTGKRYSFSYSCDGERWAGIGDSYDMTKLSDEYCAYGEFTGTMVGLFVTDGMLHKKSADFDFFDHRINEGK